MVFMQNWKNVILIAIMRSFSLRDVQCFLGFANFYRKFIQDYSKLILYLTQLTKKGQSFVCSKEADMVFVSLKKAFTSAPILAHVDSKNRSSWRQTHPISPLVAFCHKKARMKNYILWFSTHALLTPPKSTTRYMTRSY